MQKEKSSGELFPLRLVLLFVPIRPRPLRFVEEPVSVCMAHRACHAMPHDNKTGKMLFPVFTVACRYRLVQAIEAWRPVLSSISAPVAPRMEFGGAFSPPLGETLDTVTYPRTVAIHDEARPAPLPCRKKNTEMPPFPSRSQGWANRLVWDFCRAKSRWKSLSFHCQLCYRDVSQVPTMTSPRVSYIRKKWFFGAKKSNVGVLMGYKS